MVIVIKGYVPKPFDVLHQVFAVFLLSVLQGREHHCFFSVEILGAEYIYHIISSWD